jgi:hypothetical protein
MIDPIQMRRAFSAHFRLFQIKGVIFQNYWREAVLRENVWGSKRRFTNGIVAIRLRALEQIALAA